jgi:hypothetical protein
MMKWLRTTLALALLFGAGCERRVSTAPPVGGAPASTVSSPLDEHWEALEFRVRLRSEDCKPGDMIDSGEFEDVLAMVLPIRIKEGPGEAHAVKDGVWLHAGWDGVRVMEDDKRRTIAFTGFRTMVQNRFKAPYGVSWGDPGWLMIGHQAFNTEHWDLTQTPVGIDHNVGAANHDPRIWCKAWRLAPDQSRPDVLLGEARH